MSELSIFIDESGEFGNNSEYYLLTLVFHNQANDIGAELLLLESKLDELGYSKSQPVHTGPIIRREGEYRNVSLAARRAVISRLYAFARRINISYVTFTIKKKECPSNIALKSRLAKELSLFIQENLPYLTTFDKVIVYYDNGQAAITDLVNMVFSALLFEVDFRKVNPSDYRIFQTADLLCSLELSRAKTEDHTFSRSEEVFFESRRKLKKNYLDKLKRLQFKSSSS